MYKMLIFYLSAVLWFEMVTGIDYKDCGSTMGTLLNVTVSNCDQKAVCILKRGQKATIDIYFTPGERVENVTVKVYGIVSGHQVPFPDPSIVNGCNGSGLSCPLLPGQPQHYTSTLLVKRIFPRLHVGIKWILTDEHQQSIVCTEFRSRLQ
ncbi:NPC intracellular cholesterol transporter 2 homolog a [Anabrus simplex]|uniref:NPC intracellular cholesterol transporter 2 homolog a n=1 Tax=Anabrus simplex TaxID=316456 RepID=UPI0035A32C35